MWPVIPGRFPICLTPSLAGAGASLFTDADLKALVKPQIFYGGAKLSGLILGASQLNP
jgi:hypothetical protein